MTSGKAKRVVYAVELFVLLDRVLCFVYFPL